MDLLLYSLLTFTTFFFFFLIFIYFRSFIFHFSFFFFLGKFDLIWFFFFFFFYGLSRILLSYMRCGNSTIVLGYYADLNLLKTIYMFKKTLILRRIKWHISIKSDLTSRTQSRMGPRNKIAQSTCLLTFLLIWCCWLSNPAIPEYCLRWQTICYAMRKWDLVWPRWWDNSPS